MTAIRAKVSFQLCTHIHYTQYINLKSCFEYFFYKIYFEMIFTCIIINHSSLLFKKCTKFHQMKIKSLICFNEKKKSKFIWFIKFLLTRITVYLYLYTFLCASYVAQNKKV